MLSKCFLFSRRLPSHPQWFVSLQRSQTRTWRCRPPSSMIIESHSDDVVLAPGAKGFVGRRTSDFNLGTSWHLEYAKKRISWLQFKFEVQHLRKIFCANFGTLLQRVLSSAESRFYRTHVLIVFSTLYPYFIDALSHLRSFLFSYYLWMIFLPYLKLLL